MKTGWTLLIVATLFVCNFSHLGALGFVGPDEPRYAWIARDMAETGDWVTPRLYGKPWFEKPPLFYWGAAASFKVFGVSEAAARLPSAICALLATLALAWLAWRIYGAETARWFVLLLPTTVGMIGFSHAAATDMPFSGMLTVAMVCAAVVLGLLPREGVPKAGANAAAGQARAESSPQLSVPGPPWIALLLFGFFLGLAVLAKGPAGIVLCGGTVLCWALVTKRWRNAFRLIHPAAIFAFCVTALPWYVLCARRNPDFFHVFIIEHNLKRYVTPEFQHIQPFWFYVPVVLAALLPWGFLFLWDAVSGALRFRQARQIDDSTWLLICWSAFTILFFTISKSKLPGYILPAVPPLALLTSQTVKNRMHQPNTARLFLSVAGLTLVLLGVLLKLFSDSIPFVTDIVPPPGVVQFVFLAVLGGVAVIGLALFNRSSASLAAAVITVLAFMTTDTSRLWELDAGVSARPTVVRALKHLNAEQAAAVTTFKLRRAYKYQVDFYLHRETKEWSPGYAGHSIIFTSYSNWKELEALRVRCAYYIAFPAVSLCEDSKGEPVLLGGDGSSRRKPQ
ncbi:MAG TPA: glycosyltransferase family 39 protein [Candidatus Methylomirabilis sp.]|nr:glycosyltransferase family 39 protein [Candidatus Methylomirabilis sp.]